MSIITDNASAGLLDENGRPLLDEYQDPRPASADYADALMAFLPSGRVWPRDPSSTLARIAGALAPTFSRLVQRARYLLTESPVGNSLIELLPEWEATFDLPDSCAGPDPTIALRQMHVQARLAYSGGQSVPYFIGYAAALGYTITVTEFAPARADVSGADDPVYEPEWAYAWQVNVPAQTIEYAAADISFADDPLLTTGNEVLECELRRIAPAHTVLLFNYGS